MRVVISSTRYAKRHVSRDYPMIEDPDSLRTVITSPYIRSLKSYLPHPPHIVIQQSTSTKDKMLARFARPSLAGPSRIPLFLSSARPYSSKANFSRPSPPPLPASDQAEFDALLKANQTIGASPAIASPSEDLQHKDLRRGPKKDFEGDVNPKTGEMGGPKTDPFKAGDQDWQYGGRVTVGFFWDWEGLEERLS